MHLARPLPLTTPRSVQAAYCLVYVLPLYASEATRPSPTRSRDAPEAIRARVRSVTFSTTVCSLCTFLLLRQSANPLAVSLGPWHLMGYWPAGLVDALKILFLTGLLFAGPLYECLLIDGAWRQWPRLEPLRLVWSEWPVWRNLVAVCPLLSRAMGAHTHTHIHHPSMATSSTSSISLLLLLSN